MRVHTDTLTRESFIAALNAEHAAGRIARSVTFDALTEHGSRSHARAFEVRLDSYAKEENDGRRRPNSGSAYRDSYGWAATHDEWGFLIAALYRLDPAAVWGSPANPSYADSFHFDRETALSYNPAALLALLEAGDVDPYPYVRKGAQGAKVGRVGAARMNDRQHDALAAYWADVPDWALYRPRTAADVRAFAHLEAVTA